MSMRHTSVRLSESMYRRIMASGRSATGVITDALERYFKEGDDNTIRAMINEAIAEHEEREHGATIQSDTGNEKSLPREVKQVLQYIKVSLDEGVEPTTGEVYTTYKVDGRSMGIKLGQLGIRSKTTTREGRGVRVFPKSVKPKIDDILAEN